jgi:hypothetical protein
MRVFELIKLLCAVSGAFIAISTVLGVIEEPPLMASLTSLGGDPAARRRHHQVAAVNIITEEDTQHGDNSYYYEGTTCSPRFCHETSRCRVLDRSRRFSFVHISKTGGSSWIRELKTTANLPKLYPVAEEGLEHSVSYQNRQHTYDHLSYHVTSFRSPRHHVWSLWSECRFDDWGVAVRTNDFPGNGTDAAGDVEDFAKWINRFVDNETQTLRKDKISRKDSFGCYHPANYQSRPLVSVDKNPHRPASAKELVPDTTISNQTYWFMDWVAIAEFYHESKCLLFHRMVPKSEEMQNYLNETCHCRQPPLFYSSEQQQHHHYQPDAKLLHHDGRRRETMRDLDGSILQLIATATAVDMKIYRTAVQQFLREMVWLEDQLGRRVVCDDVLQKWEPELAYLNVSLSQCYRQERRAQCDRANELR